MKKSYYQEVFEMDLKQLNFGQALEFYEKGIKCYIVRHPLLGFLSGYVQVPENFNKPIKCHGGITFKGGLKEFDPENTYIGFDCGTSEDMTIYDFDSEDPKKTYKTINDVKNQIYSIVAQVQKGN